MSKKIYGITVGTPTPRSNFNQTDPRKADYLVGRENIATKEDLENVGGVSEEYVDEAIRTAILDSWEAEV